MTDLTYAWKCRAKELRAEVEKLRASAKLSYCPYCGKRDIDLKRALEHYSDCPTRPPAEVRLARHYLNQTADLQAELEAAQATLERVRALLPKWGPASVRGVYNDYARDAYMTCFNDLSAALRPPETQAQAAERVAEHGEETRLDLMQGADWLERD